VNSQGTGNFFVLRNAFRESLYQKMSASIEQGYTGAKQSGFGGMDSDIHVALTRRERGDPAGNQIVHFIHPAAEDTENVHALLVAQLLDLLSHVNAKQYTLRFCTRISRSQTEEHQHLSDYSMSRGNRGIIPSAIQFQPSDSPSPPPSTPPRPFHSTSAAV